MAPHERGIAPLADPQGQPVTDQNGGTGAVLPARPGIRRAIMALLAGGLLAMVVAIVVFATAPSGSYFLPSDQALNGILVGLAGIGLLLAGLVGLAAFAIRRAARRYGVERDRSDNLTWREGQELIRRGRR